MILLAVIDGHLKTSWLKILRWVQQMGVEKQTSFMRSWFVRVRSSPGQIEQWPYSFLEYFSYAYVVKKLKRSWLTRSGCELWTVWLA